MIVHIVIIFLMKLQCDALGNATSFAGKLRLIAAQGSDVNLPCTFSRNQSDLVTLILFYRNASHVGQVGAPLYTLDARMMYDQKQQLTTGASADVKVINKEDQTQQRLTNEYNHKQPLRQSSPIDKDTNFFINNNQAAAAEDQSLYALFASSSSSSLSSSNKRILFKRSLMIDKNKTQSNSRYSNGSSEKLSIGNVSMVNGISSLMHLLAIKGQLNQSRIGIGGKNENDHQTVNQENINLAVDSLNQATKLINIEKKNSRTTINDDDQLLNVHKTNTKLKRKPISSSYQLFQLQNDENWPPSSERSRHQNEHQVTNVAEQTRSQVNNLFDEKIQSDRLIKTSEVDQQSAESTTNQLENQPQHFVAQHLANRIKLSWPPSQLRQHHPYDSMQTEETSNSPNPTYYGDKKLESRSQTTNSKSDLLLHFNAMLNIKNATVDDAGEYLCRVDLRYGRTMIQHIVLEIISPPDKVIILDSNSQVLHDWTNAYLENSKTIFHCEVDGGRPQSPIEWLVNGELLNPTWSKSIKLQNTGVTRSQLQLPMTRDLFNGSLSCRVQNQFFTMSATVRIDLILKPQRITLRPTISPLVVDNQIDLIVQTHGSYPAADLVCFLHNQTLIGEIKKVNHFKLFSTTTLIIKYVPQRSDHNEEIICKAINHAFPINESIELKHKLDIHYKPILNLRLQNGNPNRLIEGNSIVMQCDIDSNPPYKEIQWFKNDLLFAALNNHYQSELRVENTSLVTNSLSKLDSGRYMCSARNSVGTSDSEYLTIDVLHSPQCASNQKFIYGIEYGETTQIDCSLISNPSDRLTFHWRWHDGNGNTIDLATISNQVDDSFKKSSSYSNLQPSYLSFVPQAPSNDDEIHNNSRLKNETYFNQQQQQPIASRYLSSLSSSTLSSSSFDKDNFKTHTYNSQQQHQQQRQQQFTNKPLLPSINPIDSERGNLLQQIFISSNGSSSSLHYTMKSNKKDIGSYVECWASNLIGVQKEPCMYSLVVLDVPDPVVNCTISAPINNFHLLECTPGKDGGLPPQMFHLEVYAFQNNKRTYIGKDDYIASDESNNQQTTTTTNDQLISSGSSMNGNSFNSRNQLDHHSSIINSNDFKISPYKNGDGSKPFVKLKKENPNESNQQITHYNHLNKHHHHSRNNEYNQNDNQKINFNHHQPPPPSDEYEDEDFKATTNERRDDNLFKQSNLVLIANYTEYSYPTFVLSLVNMNLTKLNLNKLSTIDTLHLIVYSSNSKGTSNKISLDFNIGNQTSQLKNLLSKTTTKQIKFDLLNEWTLIFTATLSTMMVWFLCLVCYLFISNKIKQIKMTRRYINNFNKNAIKINQQNAVVPSNHQGLVVPFIGGGNNDLQPQCNVIGSSECHDTSIYGCSSMIINHFEQKNYKQQSPNLLSSAELLKLKIKQLD